MEPNFYFVVVVAYAFGIVSKKLLPNPRSQRFRLIFSCKSSIALVLTVRSLIVLN